MIKDFVTTIPVGGTVAPGTLGTDLADLAAHLGLRNSAAPVLASAATTSIFAGTADAVRNVEISGTTGITSFGANDAGEFRVVRFQGVLTVNHSAALVLPGAANVTTQAGTMMVVLGAGGTNAVVWDVFQPSSLAGVTAGLPAGHLFGLTLSNNAIDAANDIDIAVGRARSDDDTVNIVLSGVLVKRLDAVWAAGTNQGGLDTGSKANSTTYHVFAIANAAGSLNDVLFSASLASPTLPGGYTVKRRIGSLFTDASGNLVLFSQVGDEFLAKGATLDINVGSLAATTRQLGALGVPGGLALDAIIRSYSPLSGGQLFIMTDPAEADAAPSLSAVPGHTLNAAGQQHQGRVRTNTSRQIAYRGNTTGTILRVWTYGWIDRRGRDA